MPPTKDFTRQENERIGMALRQARKKAWGVYGSLARTAEMAGVSQGTLSAIERGEHSLSKVRTENLQNFPEAYGMTARQFVDLTGVALVTPADKNSDIVSGVSITTNVHRVPVRTLAATGDSFFSEAAIINYHYVPDEFFRPNMLIAYAQDSSMAPLIGAGDYVLVDQDKKDMVESSIYLLRLDDSSYAIRRCRAVLGALVFVADDPSYSAVSPDTVQIVGTAYRRQPEGDNL